MAIQDYNITLLPHLKSSITLLKLTFTLILPEVDYGLHKITESAVQIHYVEGTHITMMDNEKIASFINEALLLGLQKKIYVANRALEHFTFNEWKFDNTNSRALMSSIPFDDREAFSIDLSDADIEKCIRNGIIGVKKYLLHEDMNRLDAAKTHCKRVDQFVATFKTIIAIGMLWMIYKWICF